MTRTRRIALWAEMAGLYLLVPLAVFALVGGLGAPILLPVAIVFVLVGAALCFDDGFSWRQLLARPVSARDLWSVMGLFALLGGLVTLVAWIWLPETFLSFPIRRPGHWLAVVVLYPLISVTAQEIMFRVFFLHRYGALFEGMLPVAIVVNAALFAFAHILFASWITVAVGLAGGLIFAWRYLTTRSFWTVVLEHSLYGNLIYTVGLGRYFLSGVPLG